jgi:Protein of unknown function (DUF1320)
MPIITPADLQTNLYAEIIDEITRGDTFLTDAAIASAIAEAQMYLEQYDLVLLFGTSVAPPGNRDALLASLVTDIACRNLLKLCNAGADITLAENAYKNAVATLEKIKEGKLNPAGWVYADKSSETAPQGDAVAAFSCPKRNNYY